MYPPGKLAVANFEYREAGGGVNFPHGQPAKYKNGRKPGESQNACEHSQQAHSSIKRGAVNVSSMGNFSMDEKSKTK